MIQGYTHIRLITATQAPDERAGTDRCHAFCSRSRIRIQACGVTVKDRLTPLRRESLLIHMEEEQDGERDQLDLLLFLPIINKTYLLDLCYEKSWPRTHIQTSVRCNPK